jgi:hypothetical protein
MTIRVLSFDFDGCLFNASFLDNYLKEENGFIRANQTFLDKLKIEARDFDQTITFVGSNRQSLEDDFRNSGWGKGSCFPRILEVSRYIGADKFDPFLMADIYSEKPSGSAFAKAIKKSANDYTSRAKMKLEEHDDWIHDKGKLTILYAQMHKVASENPGEDIEYTFFDDRDDILNGLHNFFTNYPKMIPANLKLNLKKYDGSEVQPILSLKGTGKIDGRFANTVMQMADIGLRNDELATVKSYQDAKKQKFVNLAAINIVEHFKPSHPSFFKRHKRGVLSSIALGVGLLIGAGVGIALVATGVLAPFGAGILGFTAMAALGALGGIVLSGTGVGIGLASTKLNQQESAVVANEKPNLGASSSYGLMHKKGLVSTPSTTVLDLSQESSLEGEERQNLSTEVTALLSSSVKHNESTAIDSKFSLI